jgi:hypothetical protein
LAKGKLMVKRWWREMNEVWEVLKVEDSKTIGKKE